MIKAIAMTVAVLGWGAVEAAGRQPVDAGEVRVRVYCEVDSKVMLDGMLLSLAKTRASELLAEAGIRLEWRPGKPAAGETGRQVIGMTFVPVAPPDFQSPERASALAAARPYGNGHTILIFQDRVTAYLGNQGAFQKSQVLGHILAHEIVHVLQRVCRHSDTGLMMAHWRWREMALMIGPGLPLSEHDRELLRLWFIQPVLAASTQSAVAEDATR